MLLQHVATTFLRLLLCDVYHHTLSIMCLNKRDRYEIHHQLIETCFGLRGNLEFPDVLHVILTDIEDLVVAVADKFRNRVVA